MDRDNAPYRMYTHLAAWLHGRLRCSSSAPCLHRRGRLLLEMTARKEAVCGGRRDELDPVGRDS